MGAARVTRSAPGEYLRKGASKTVLPAPGNFSYGDSAKKPGVPRRSEQPVHGLTTSKNFITSNAIENILSGALFSSLLPAPYSALKPSRAPLRQMC